MLEALVPILDLHALYFHWVSPGCNALSECTTGMAPDTHALLRCAVRLFPKRRSSRPHKTYPRPSALPYTPRNPVHEGRAKIERLLRGGAGARLRRFCSVRSAAARKLPQMPGQVSEAVRFSAMTRTAALRKRRRSALYPSSRSSSRSANDVSPATYRPGGTRGSLAS